MIDRINTLTWLRSVDTLKDVPEAQLEWLYNHSEWETQQAGSFLYQSGDRIKGTYIIKSGQFRLVVTTGAGTGEVDTFGPNDITGFLPFSRGTIFVGSGEVLSNLEYLFFPVEHQGKLISTQYELTQALVHVMTSRIRHFTAFQLQNEKIMALGKLSAGLAHELNNPVAAVLRSAVLLGELLSAGEVVPETSGKEDIKKLLKSIVIRQRPELNLLQRSEQEIQLSSWLKVLQLSGRLEIAENLATYGFTIADLESLHDLMTPPELSAFISAINKTLTAQSLVADITNASKRIGDLVAAVKTFTHMDQGNDKRQTDVHEGIKSVLQLMRHKLAQNNIRIEEHYDQTLPEIAAMAGELNQLWTNLIDNAIDAMAENGGGILRIKTGMAGTCIRVSITDNGTGIPDAIKNAIFDPFFTTKSIGKGTGLGLDIVARIVRRHQGRVKIESEPGRTTFAVDLPVQQNTNQLPL